MPPANVNGPGRVDVEVPKLPGTAGQVDVPPVAVVVAVVAVVRVVGGVVGYVVGTALVVVVPAGPPPEIY